MGKSQNNALSYVMWVASLIAGSAAGCLITDPENGWRLSMIVLLPTSFILPLFCTKLPQLCPLIILIATPLGGLIAERFFDAKIGNLTPPFYFIWSLLWVAIGGVLGTSIGLCFRKDKKVLTAQSINEGKEEMT